eukprot:COSAG02_NODE_298_length_25350_cov_48.266999_24_plen_62_part_00
MSISSNILFISIRRLTQYNLGSPASKADPERAGGARKNKVKSTQKLVELQTALGSQYLVQY